MKLGSLVALAPTLIVGAALGAPPPAVADHHRSERGRSGYERAYRDHSDRSYRQGYKRGRRNGYTRGRHHGYRHGHHLGDGAQWE